MKNLAFFNRIKNRLINEPVFKLYTLNMYMFRIHFSFVRPLSAKNTAMVNRYLHLVRKERERGLLTRILLTFFFPGKTSAITN